jgi:hypothetical protein
VPISGSGHDGWVRRLRAERMARTDETDGHAFSLPRPLGASPGRHDIGGR